MQKVVLGVYDSSLDGNMDILKQSMFEYYNLQKQVKILEHKKNNWLASARLTGLANCTGNIRYFKLPKNNERVHLKKSEYYQIET